MLQKLQKRKKIRESQTKKKVIKKRKGLQRDIKKYISILIEDLKQARAIAEAEPWTNLDVISKHKHYRVFLGEFLRGDYYYKNLGEDRIKIWNSWWKQGFRVSLYDFNLIGADLRGIDLEGANLEHINLWKANLAGADLRRANLGNGHLYEAILKGADLKGADLSGANLRWADLRRANLAGANLRLADLEEANLRRTDIRGADLWAANLRKANLAGADLWGADLKGADLEHADLTMVKTLTKEQLHSAKNWEKAKNIPEELL
ncbi:MAG: pentapeptide repeat-containing protein [Nanoarchaeota archaeon]|nr:pentapeptide repeat-containing protein [Nanoarchaeota archaeon]